MSFLPTKLQQHLTIYYYTSHFLMHSMKYAKAFKRNVDKVLSICYKILLA